MITKAELKRLTDQYFDWLRDQTITKNVGGGIEITTPFLDRHNDWLQFYIIPTKTGFHLTDDGYVISDLEASGCPLKSPHRHELFRSILNGFGVQEKNGELCVDASHATLPQKKHALIQAMLAVNDLFLTAKHRVAKLFLEDIADFFDSHDIRYTENISVHGKSNLPHRFDFLIPKSRKQPERLIIAINTPNRQAAKAALFTWTDVRETRPHDSRLLALLNDSEDRQVTDVVAAFDAYEVPTILWSERDRHIAELAA